ncbi:MAG: copper chaperone CopZ [Synergistaceae bacterium]|jgi:copper chaperone|nr:copper chaperone CopZ [Synergistaceae bacterium]
MEKKVFNVEGMSCSHCVKAVTDAVTALDGVSDVKVDLQGGTAAVEYDAARVSDERIRGAIEDQGYDVRV